METLTYEEATAEAAKLNYTPTEWKNYTVRTENERYILGVLILQKVLNGKSLRTIERDMGIPRATVARYRDKALTRIEAPIIEHARTVELDRLDMLIEAVWDNAMTGDKDAIASYVKLSDKRAALLGLNKPIEISQTVTEITPQERELQDLLAQAERDAKMEEAKLNETQSTEVPS